jgi:hypothetical protein
MKKPSPKPRKRSIAVNVAAAKKAVATKKRMKAAREDRLRISIFR